MFKMEQVFRTDVNNFFRLITSSLSLLLRQELASSYRMLDLLKFVVICNKVTGMFLILIQTLRHQKIKVGKIAVLSDSSWVEKRKTFTRDDTLSWQVCSNSFCSGSWLSSRVWKLHVTGWSESLLSITRRTFGLRNQSDHRRQTQGL